MNEIEIYDKLYDLLNTPGIISDEGYQKMNELLLPIPPPGQKQFFIGFDRAAEELKYEDGVPYMDFEVKNGD